MSFATNTQLHSRKPLFSLNTIFYPLSEPDKAAKHLIAPHTSTPFKEQEKQQPSDINRAPVTLQSIPVRNLAASQAGTCKAGQISTVQELIEMGRMLPCGRKLPAVSGSPVDGCRAARSQPTAPNSLAFLACSAEVEQVMLKWFIYGSVVVFLELNPAQCEAWC